MNNYNSGLPFCKLTVQQFLARIWARLVMACVVKDKAGTSEEYMGISPIKSSIVNQRCNSNGIFPDIYTDATLCHAGFGAAVEVVDLDAVTSMSILLLFPRHHTILCPRLIQQCTIHFCIMMITTMRIWK